VTELLPETQTRAESGVSSRPPNWFIILLLGALSVITPFAVDMYLPAFSRIAAEFKTSTSAVSLSLSAYFIAFALGQVLYGPLLDHFGRKRPLYFGLTIYIAASLGCAHPHDMRTFIAFRFLQALGGCVAQVAAVAMVRDFFPSRESARIFSLLFLVIGVSPLLAPTAGSVIMTWLGWEWIFAVLACIAAAILALTFFLLPEGHTPDPTISLRPEPILRHFREIFRRPQFCIYALAGAFSFAGLFGYVAGSPMIFMDGFHVSAKIFGAIFATLTMGFIGGNQVNVILLRRWTSTQIFGHAVTVQVLIGALFVVGARLGWFGITATLILFFLFLSCIGLTYPNAAAMALAPFSRNVGSASALLGFLQTGTGAMISTCIGFFGGTAVVGLLSGSALLALLIFVAGRRSSVEEVKADDERAVFVPH
jgi:DHA1 family bicyclomycin/chloramphenicol resistance-like MFS transporter